MFSLSELDRSAGMFVSKGPINQNENKTSQQRKTDSKEIKTKKICTKGVSESIIQKIPWEIERKKETP